jgi:hypothetical protein
LTSPRDRRRVDTRIEEFGRGLSARVRRKTRFRGERSAPDMFLSLFWFIYVVGIEIMLRPHAWVYVNIGMQWFALVMLLEHPICVGLIWIAKHAK